MLVGSLLIVRFQQHKLYFLKTLLYKSYKTKKYFIFFKRNSWIKFNSCVQRKVMSDFPGKIVRISPLWLFFFVVAKSLFLEFSEKMSNFFFKKIDCKKFSKFNSNEFSSKNFSKIVFNEFLAKSNFETFLLLNSLQNNFENFVLLNSLKKQIRKFLGKFEKKTFSTKKGEIRTPICKCQSSDLPKRQATDSSYKPMCKILKLPSYKLQIFRTDHFSGLTFPTIFPGKSNMTFRWVLMF